LWVVVAVFVLSRIWWQWAGVRLDMSPLGTYWQYLDPEILRGDFWRSLFYLHSQPPLFNAFLGAVVTNFPGQGELVFRLAYWGCGLTLAVTLYLLLGRLGVPAAWSATTTLGLVLSPACIAFENFLFYSYPVAVMLALSAYFLQRFWETEQRRDGVIFFALVAALALTRTIFHLAWVVVVVLGLLGVSRHYRRGLGGSILMAATAPVLLVAALYLKNELVFGEFTSSTWLGMNLATMTVQLLPPEEKQQLVAEGKISDVSLVVPFEPLDRYPPRFRTRPTGIAVLDEVNKPGGDPNFNNLAYIGIARAYQRDALASIREDPDEYLEAVLVTGWGYLRPNSKSLGLSEHNQEILRPWEAVYRTLFLAYPATEPDTDDFWGLVWSRLAQRGLMLEFGLPLVLLYGGWRVLRLFGRAEGDGARAITLAYLGFTGLYFTLITVTLNGREANRVRFEITPCLVVLFAVLAWRGFCRGREMWLKRKVNQEGGASEGRV
jgi:hypothetical protein